MGYHLQRKRIEKEAAAGGKKLKEDMFNYFVSGSMDGYFATEWVRRFS